MKNIVVHSGTLLMGGIERILIEVLKNLDKNKYRIFLFIEKDWGEENVFYDEIPEEVKVYFLKSEGLIKKAEYYRSKKKNLYYKLLYNIQMKKERAIGDGNFFKYIKEIEKEFGEIQAFLDFNCGKNKIIKKVNIKNKLAWIHISMPKLLQSRGKLYRFGKRLRGYNKVVTICDEMSEEMINLYPYLKSKIVRCYNPFDFNRIIKLSEDYSELNVIEKELIKDKYIVAVSRLDLNSKDYYTLISAYKIYYENGGEYKLYIIGGGKDYNKIKEFIEQNKLQNQVLLIGEKKNPYIWMKNSKMFVHSSVAEGMPTVLVEAMICGKVVLSSDCPTGPTEILSKDNCGVLFKTKNVEELAEKLQKLLEEENLDLYQERIKRRIEEFKVKNIMKEYEKIINGE